MRVNKFLRRARRHYGYNYDHCQVTITTFSRKYDSDRIRSCVPLFSSDLEVFSKRLTHFRKSIVYNLVVAVTALEPIVRKEKIMTREEDSYVGYDRSAARLKKGSTYSYI